MVRTQGARLALIGAMLGVAGVFVLTPFLRTLLLGNFSRWTP
jgi:hypothetical protein